MITKNKLLQVTLLILVDEIVLAKATFYNIQESHLNHHQKESYAAIDGYLDVGIGDKDILRSFKMDIRKYVLGQLETR